MTTGTKHRPLIRGALYGGCLILLYGLLAYGYKTVWALGVLAFVIWILLNSRLVKWAGRLPVTPQMSTSAREQFRRAGRDIIWIPGFFLSLALLVNIIASIAVKTFEFGDRQLWTGAVYASIGGWLIREFIRFWWYQFRTRQKEIRIGRRFTIDLRERSQDQSEDLPLVRR